MCMHISDTTPQDKIGQNFHSKNNQITGPVPALKCWNHTHCVKTISAQTGGAKAVNSDHSPCLCIEIKDKIRLLKSFQFF